MQDTNFQVLKASKIIGEDVKNAQGEQLGNIKEIMIDAKTGNIGYAVLSFGGFLGIGGKLFAIPWEALNWDFQNENFILNVNKEKLEKATGFDKDKWPSASDKKFVTAIHTYYGVKPYWKKEKSIVEEMV